MQKFRYILVVCGIVILIAHVMLMDFNDLRWDVNRGSYLGIVSMIGLVSAMIISIGRNNSKQWVRSS
jgi:uncharacterized membrane protein